MVICGCYRSFMCSTKSPNIEINLLVTCHSLSSLCIVFIANNFIGYLGYWCCQTTQQVQKNALRSWINALKKCISKTIDFIAFCIKAETIKETEFTRAYPDLIRTPLNTGSRTHAHRRKKVTYYRRAKTKRLRSMVNLRAI